MQEATIPFGLCGCGCGRKTKIAQRHNARLGVVKGKPNRFVVGHVNRLSGIDYIERDCGYETPCWVWQRHINAAGYGQHSGRLGHVEQWKQRHGPVPEGLELDHLCRNPACVNPDHLEPVTHLENVRRGAGAKLTVDQVREIRSSDDVALEVAQRLGVSRGTIYHVRAGRQWKGV